MEIKMETKQYEKLANDIRKDVLKLTYEKKAGFIGSSFSCADIFAVLYGGYVKLNVNDAQDENNDTVILSKGHAASAWYAALANIGAIEKERLFEEFHKSTGKLGVHPKRNSAVGIETSTGSLGQGLGLGCGVALAHKIKGRSNRVYVILGDGECNEGSVWESFMLAKRYKLNNLVVFIDRNKLQSYGHDEDVLNMEEMKPRLESFGFNTLEIDGHSHKEIDEALSNAMNSDKPTAIIANSIKGKGVSEFEDKVLWHYKWPEIEHYETGLKELNENA